MDPLDRLFTVATRFPDHPAVVGEAETWSYRDFVRMVRTLAGAIAAGVPGQHPRVHIHLPQGAHSYAAMFATLMAGGFYSTTNLCAPAIRQQQVVDLFDPDVVVTATDVPALDFGRAAVVAAESQQGGELEAALPAHDLAYVFFTSGSTGQPKGVMIPRSGLAHYTEWAITSMAVTPDDRWSQHPNIAFDLSVLDIYGALCAGASLHPIVRRGDRLSPAEFIHRRGLTIWDSVPSVLDIMRQRKEITAERFASLRLLTFCGEPLLPDHLDAIFAARPDVVVHNTYGPTEATVSCTLLRLERETYKAACAGPSVAFGDPIPGMGLTLIGGESADEGEIVLTGPQVARGYWGDRTQTAAAFRMAMIDGNLQWAYHTGDWAKRRDGHTYFATRIDRQVKIHGNRLELGDVDAALRGAGVISGATVAVSGQLHAFIEAQEGLDVGRLRVALARTLPAYAIPTAFHVVAELPRNANDKVDSRALTAMVESKGGIGC
ncbi:MAG: AMP-binding protein [Magnetospirillum sp.]|nr:AMP-binding protein [Magnetospirillum sp.]